MDTAPLEVEDLAHARLPVFLELVVEIRRDQPAHGNNREDSAPAIANAEAALWAVAPDVKRSDYVDGMNEMLSAWSGSDDLFAQAVRMGGHLHAWTGCAADDPPWLAEIDKSGSSTNGQDSPTPADDLLELVKTPEGRDRYEAAKGTLELIEAAADSVPRLADDITDEQWKRHRKKVVEEAIENITTAVADLRYELRGAELRAGDDDDE